MLILHQAEWCPFSSGVRERPTELGIDFVAQQVAPRPEQRSQLLAHARVDASGTTEIRATANGPLLVRGRLRLLGADGTELAQLDKAALCRCGQSGNKPFCDGTHKRVGFRDAPAS